MQLLLQQWIAKTSGRLRPRAGGVSSGRKDQRVIGGRSCLLLPPGNEDLEIGWQLHPNIWGHGYASETTYALAQWAFSQGEDDIFAVVRPDSIRTAATVRRNGMEWVGETSADFWMTMQVFRPRPADLNRSAPQTDVPPNFDARRPPDRLVRDDITTAKPARHCHPSTESDSPPTMGPNTGSH
jgi:hypothetical protein